MYLEPKTIPEKLSVIRYLDCHVYLIPLGVRVVDHRPWLAIDLVDLVCPHFSLLRSTTLYIRHSCPFLTSITNPELREGLCQTSPQISDKDDAMNLIVVVTLPIPVPSCLAPGSASQLLDRSLLD